MEREKLTRPSSMGWFVPVQAADRSESVARAKAKSMRDIDARP